MPEPGQEIKRANGFVVRIVTLEDDLLEVEASYRGDAPLAQAHYHPSQDEHFEVLEGKIHAVVDGDERWYEEGETFDIPAGTPHQMAAEGPTRIRRQVRPALRTAESSSASTTRSTTVSPRARRAKSSWPSTTTCSG